MNSFFDPLVQGPLSSGPAMLAAHRRNEGGDAALSNAKPSPTSIGETPAIQPAGNLQAALSLAKEGVSVFPCLLDKKPLVEHWREQSTSDADQIQAWWAQYPNALVAIDCGKSGLVVINCDQHGGPDGVAAFKKLVEDNRGKDEHKPPQTQTPNNGVHVIFRQPSTGEPLGSSRGNLPEGIDVRGAGGYIIASGSQLPDGRAWMAKESTPALAEVCAARTIPEVPVWLLALLRPVQQELHSSSHFQRRPDTESSPIDDQAPANEKPSSADDVQLDDEMPIGDQPGQEPDFICWGGFTMDEDGLHVEVTRGRGDNAETGKEWISAAFEVIGQARDPQGNGWGKYLRWYDADGRPHTKYVGDSALHSDPGALCANLADEGLRINRGKQREFVTYLAGCRVRCRVTRVNCTGWHDVEGKRVFVLPTSTIGTAGSATVLLDAPARGQYESVGTLDEWKNSVGEAARGHILPVLAVSASFAGPLLGLIGQEGGGIHIYGRSSAGKTTLLLVAASVWGPPKFARAWRSTANGLEGASVLANDTILILDELGVIEAREAAPALYGLSNGTGKARARRDGSLREPTKWNMITLSSGEVRTETKLAEDRGRKARAGQLVRMLDIPAERGKRFGVFDHGGIGADAAEIAKHLKDTAAAVFGTAGPAFVRKIIAEGADEIAQMVQEEIQKFAATNVPSGSDSQIGRAAKRLGLIAAAGELAATFGIVPWEAGEARRAATWALKAWISQRGGTEPAEENQAIEQICHFIEAHGESRFQPLDIPDAPRVINRAGWSKGKELDREWLCAPDVWKREMCAGLDPKFCATVLKKRGMLRTQSDKLQIVATIDGRSQRVYAVTHAIFEGSSDET